MRGPLSIYHFISLFLSFASIRAFVIKLFTTIIYYFLLLSNGTVHINVMQKCAHSSVKEVKTLFLIKKDVNIKVVYEFNLPMVLKKHFVHYMIIN